MFRWIVAAGAETGYLTISHQVTVSHLREMVRTGDRSKLEFVERTRYVSRQIAVGGDTCRKTGAVSIRWALCRKNPERKRFVREKRLEAGLPVFREAFLTVDRSSFRWLERYFAFFSAV